METVDAHTFTPGKLVDWGSLSGEMAFHPETKPPVNDPEETIAITFPDSADSVWTFCGFMLTYQPTGVLEDCMLATFSIKVSGDITIT